MSFKDMVESDNLSVFLDTEYFGEEHSIRYDGETYEKVPCVITQLKEQDRSTTMSDHAQDYTEYPPFCTADWMISEVSCPRRAGKSISATTLSCGGILLPRQAATWAWFGWNWRRLTNEHDQGRGRRPEYA